MDQPGSIDLGCSASVLSPQGWGGGNGVGLRVWVSGLQDRFLQPQAGLRPVRLFIMGQDGVGMSVSSDGGQGWCSVSRLQL